MATTACLGLRGVVSCAEAQIIKAACYLALFRTTTPYSKEDVLTYYMLMHPQTTDPCVIYGNKRLQQLRGVLNAKNDATIVRPKGGGSP
jgi:hypothetical protein